ncbi:hypothetical protein SBA6_410047 [Candidatus Sulfopaludibacter sp. SbA6]|nr:hypothetical protein SBA6_410047 [Candidatus Sulfopaludibacter sp. SbA6]
MSAEISFQRSGRDPSLWLQWGRAQLSAEMVYAPASAVHVWSASMGPRSIERGNHTSRLRVSPACSASMGPRSIERGNDTRQRGLGGVLYALQWGRAQLSAEITAYRGSSRRNGIRFNGAALN